MKGRCPGCGHDVPLLPPRPVVNRTALVRPWRRKAHTVEGRSLSQARVPRCRWTVTLSPSEIPEGVPSP